MSREIHIIGVTGATGGIGGEVMRAGENYPAIELVPIVRNKNYIADKHSQGQDARWIDFGTSKMLEYRLALEGLDVLIHLAGSTNERNDFSMHWINIVRATSKLAKVASEEGIPIIYAGSTAQYTNNTERLIDDLTPPKSTSAYGSSKIRAHEAAKRFENDNTRERGYRAIQVVPGITIGADANWTHFLAGGGPRVRFMELLMQNSEIGWSNMDDVVNLFIKVAMNPYAGTSERYLAVNGMANTNDLLKFFAELGGRKLPPALPKKPIEPMVRIALRVMGKYAPVSPEALSFGLHGEDRRFIPSAAGRELGWNPKSLEQTFEEIRAGYTPR